MAKKSRWWFKGTDEEDSVLFPETVKKHNSEIVAPVYQQGELLNMEDYIGEDYYGWGRKPSSSNDTIRLGLDNEYDEFFEDDDDTDTKKEDRRKASIKKNTDDFNLEWDNRMSKNSWQGYSSYRTQILSYQYVQQMANAIASQHKITVKVGNEWVCDLNTKTLTYNPTTLVYNSKSELLATLLHEIGKLRYSKGFNELKYDEKGKPLSTYLDTYGTIAYTAMLPFEELRIDTKMLGEYGSAGEIYESQEPALLAVYNGYKTLSKKYKQVVIDSAWNEFNRITNDANDSSAHIMIMAKIFMKEGMSQEKAIGESVRAYEIGGRGGEEGVLYAKFGVKTRQEVAKKLDEMAKKILVTDTIFDYIASVYSEAYMLKKDADFSKGMVERLKKTNPSFKPIVNSTDTTEVVKEMNGYVYPVIEDLLKQQKDGMDELEELGGKEFKKAVNDGVKKMMAQVGQQGASQFDKNGNQKVRLGGSAPTDDSTVPEWFSGNYKILKDSVKSEISRLTRKLTFLKRTESTVKWTSNQRRGRLNMKKLYRTRLGNRRVFKSKLESTDTIRSFAFSIVIDVSGSMTGSRIANTTRGMIILAEVFKDMGIPFEIITFDDGAKTIKSFDGTFDKKVENKIGGLPKYDGGGTNLDRGLKLMKLKDRVERNKICIVLTDGGVGDPEGYNAQFFRPMLQKDHIKSLAFGLEIKKQEIEKLCNGTGRAIENAVEVPYVFADLLKSLMIKK